MELFSGVIFIVCYLFAFFVRKNKDYKLDGKPSLVLKNVHYIALFFCGVAILLYNVFDLTFYGSWTTRIFIITAFFTGVFFHLISSKVYANKIEKIYFTVLSFIPMGLFAFLLVPFFGLIVAVSLWLMLFCPGEKVYEDDKLVIKECSKGVLSAAKFEVIERRGIFDNAEPLGYTEFADSVAVRYEKNKAKIYLYDRSIDDNSMKVADSLKVDINE